MAATLVRYPRWIVESHRPAFGHFVWMLAGTPALCRLRHNSSRQKLSPKNSSVDTRRFGGVSRNGCPILRFVNGPELPPMKTQCIRFRQVMSVLSTTTVRLPNKETNSSYPIYLSATYRNTVHPQHSVPLCSSATQKP